MNPDDVVARAREALATTRAQESMFWPHQLVVDLLAELEQARADLEARDPVTTVEQLLQSHRLSPSGSIFEPESLQDIRDRLAFIEANECDCDESPHTNALHDLAYDDVPALLWAVEQIGELPKPSYTDAEGTGCRWTGKPGDGLADWSVYVISSDVCSDVRVYAQNSGGVTPAQARTVASWWLAAATAAENHP